MDEFEQRISVLLDDAVPEPRSAIDIEDIRDLTRSRHASMRQRVRRAARRRDHRTGVAVDRRRRLAIVGAVVVSAAIAVGGYALAGGPHPAPVAQPSVTTTDPSELTSTSWQLTQVIDPSGAVPSPASAPVVFTFHDGYATDHAGSAAAAHILPGRIQLGPWHNDLMLSPRPRLDIVQSNFVYKLMHEPLAWSITGDTLTFADASGASLVFTRHTFNPNQAYGSISGQFMAVGGPAGIASPRPVHGIGTVDYTNTDTGQTQTGDTGTGGDYGTSIPPGTYTIKGYISTYQNGDVACSATKPVVVQEDRITKADVYCQER